MDSRGAFSRLFTFTNSAWAVVYIGRSSIVNLSISFCTYADNGEQPASWSKRAGIKLSQIPIVMGTCGRAFSKRRCHSRGVALSDLRKLDAEQPRGPTKPAGMCYRGKPCLGSRLRRHGSSNNHIGILVVFSTQGNCLTMTCRRMIHHPIAFTRPSSCSGSFTSCRSWCSREGAVGPPAPRQTVLRVKSSS